MVSLHTLIRIDLDTDVHQIVQLLSHISPRVALALLADAVGVGAGGAANSLRGANVGQNGVVGMSVDAAVGAATGAVGVGGATASAGAVGEVYGRVAAGARVALVF